MKVHLVFANFPAGQFSILWDLPPGRLGDVLNDLLKLFHAWGRLPGLQQIEDVSGPKGAPIDANGVIQDNFIYDSKNAKILGPSLPPAYTSIHLRCSWDEAESNRAQGFRLPIHAPIVPKLITGPIKVTPDVIELMALASPSALKAERPVLTAPTLDPKRLAKLRVYFTSAISEGFNAGDPDYIDSVVRGLNLSGVQATRLVGDSPQVQEKLKIYEKGHLTPLDYLTLAEKMAAEKNTKLEVLREQARLAISKNQGEQQKGKQAKADYLQYLKQGAVHATLDYVLGRQREEKDAIHILHIQSRLPDSGSAFDDHRLIEIFQKHGVKVIVTVHEFKYNLRNADDPIHNVAFLNECCVPADRVVFLNERDLQCAVETVKRGFVSIPETIKLKDKQQPRDVGKVARFNLLRKARHIPVAITVPALKERSKSRQNPIKIILFGMIRPGKGDKSAIKLAQLIAKTGKDWRVVVVGKVASVDTLKELLNHAFGAQNVQQALGKHDQFPKEEEQQRALVDKLMKDRALARREYELKMVSFRPKQKLLQAAYEKLKLELAPLVKTRSVLEMKQLGEEDKKAITNARIAIGKAQAEALGPEWLLLPLDVYVNVTKEEANAIFQECKYAYKEDEKGMADNASSIISCMANGCITFTKLGKLTPKEFQALAIKSEELTLGEFQEVQLSRLLNGGRLLSRNESGFRIYPSTNKTMRFESLRFDDALVCPGEEDEEATPEFVAQEILRREHDSAPNARTLEAMADVIDHRFWPLEIARNHCLLYLEKM